MKQNTTLNKYLALLVTFFCAMAIGYGQSIFDNDIDGVSPNFPNLNNPFITGQDVDGNITASGISRGTGIGGDDAENRYNARTWVAASLDVNKYFEFTLTPNATYEINFVSLVYDPQRSGSGPTNSAIRSSLDGFANNIVTANTGGTITIDLSSATFQNISSAITFRIYAWGAALNIGTFSINNFTFNGAVNVMACPATTTWAAGAWDNGIPDLITTAVINANYNTTANGSFTACQLTINPTFRLTVGNSTFVEIENEVIVTGELYVETQGNFVQNDDAGTFTNNGTSLVNKTTALKQAWYYYTYWSSPVTGETIAGAFPNTDADRRFLFNATNYLDLDGDDVDDDGNDWEIANGTDVMIPGVGYAATSGQFGLYPGTDIATFNGAFNTGDILTGITYNAANLNSWNLIGNPYPSAIDFDAFHADNSGVIAGVAYYWSQFSPPDGGNAGNQNLNFSQNDYATYTVGTGGAAGPSGVTPTQYVPSGQSFFIVGAANGSVTFDNAMRMTDITSNNQFFRTAQSKTKTNSNENRLWIDLTSDNGIYNQILVGYVDNATDQNDGLNYDAPRNLSSGLAAVLYSKMNKNNDKFVIQGKAINSINEDEIISIGFKTTIDVATIYTLSIAQLEGAFLNNNAIYVKDNLLNKLHDLKTNDYNFTSEVGEFNERFEIVFNSEALSADEHIVKNNSLSIIELQNGNIQFKLSGNLAMKSIQIIDLQGRTIYSLNANGNSKTYNLSNLSQAPYIAKVALTDGYVITKKAIKRH